MHAKVLSVQRQKVQQPAYCCTVTDAPLQSSSFVYNVSVRVGCTRYDGRYETPYEWFPAFISQGKSVDVRMTKHNMYFEGIGAEELKVPITRRITTGNCK